MFELTIVAEDVAGLVSQMQTFISAFGGVALGAGFAGAAKVAAKVTVAKTEAEKPKADDKKAEQEQEGKEAAAALKKAQDDALALARDVFATGKAGAAAVKKLPGEYGVKKLQDVPVEKAAELLAKVKALKAEHVNA